MIFPNLELEATVSIGDKTRLSSVKSFLTPDEAAISLIEIEPSSGSGFIDVTTLKYLDWEFTGGVTRSETISARVTTDGAPFLITSTIAVISVADDALFSADTDLVSQEPDILNWIRPGRNSFLDMHRKAQQQILDWLDENNHHDINGARIDKADIIDHEEVRAWSTFLTLRLIFEGISNSLDDIFRDKANLYGSLEAGARDRGILRIDVNNDGTIGVNEGVNLTTLDLVRR